MLVVRPTGRYSTNTVNDLVWLPGLKWPTDYRQSHDSLANEKWAGMRRQPHPALTNNAKERAVAGISVTRDQTRHKALIAKIVASDEGFQDSGFWAAMRSLSDEIDGDLPDKLSFIPDVFRISRHGKTVEIHEAVITHAPSLPALIEMGWLWFVFDGGGWDAHGWKLRLFLHYPTAKDPSEVILSEYYHQLVEANALTLRVSSHSVVWDI